MRSERVGGGSSGETPEKPKIESERRLGHNHLEAGPGWRMELKIRPGLKLEKQEFLKLHRRTIAMDGAVKNAPSFRDPSTLNTNFDHHLGDDPLENMATLTTCQQTLEAVDEDPGGIIDFYRDPDTQQVSFSILVEDCDPDVSAGYLNFLLKLQYPEVITPPEGNRKYEARRARLDRMMRVLGTMDKNGGYYRGKVTPFVEQCVWAVAPYFDARSKNLIETMDGKGMNDIIQETCRRLMSIIIGDGTAERKPIQGSFDTLSEFDAYDSPGAPKIAFIREIDAQGAKTEAFGVKGLDVIVSVFEGRKILLNGQETQLYIYKFNVGGTFVNYSNRYTYEKLNAYICEENANWNLAWLDSPGRIWGEDESPDTAGGGPIAGGSPKAGIPVPPEKLQELMQSWLKEFYDQRKVRR